MVMACIGKGIPPDMKPCLAATAEGAGRGGDVTMAAVEPTGPGIALTARQEQANAAGLPMARVSSGATAPDAAWARDRIGGRLSEGSEEPGKGPEASWSVARDRGLLLRISPHALAVCLSGAPLLAGAKGM